jgi:hypothetical protein
MRRAILTAILLTFPGAAAFAQQTGQPPLGDIARKAEAAHATAKKATRTYTNADLGAPVTEAPTAGGFMSESLGKPVSADELIERSQAEVDQESGAALPEEHWRGRADFIRAEAARAHARSAQIKKDDSGNKFAQANNAQQLRRIQEMLDGLASQWDKLEESAHVAKVNPDWIGPRPDFSMQAPVQ